ncbi:MAG: TIGR02391 family protein [bacterium]
MLRELTGFEKGSDAFGKSKLHIKGAAAKNVDHDFNEAVKYLAMAIDQFRNEKSHTSNAKIDDPIRAYEYLSLSSLAMNLLDNAEILE